MHCVKPHTLPTLYISDTIIEEKLVKTKKKKHRYN